MTVATAQPEVVVVGPVAAGATSPAATSPELLSNVIRPSSRSHALTLLRRDGKAASTPAPAVVLVDLATHGAHAWKFLRKIKSDSVLKRVPVIVVGTSDSRTEQDRAYELRANSYVPNHEGRPLDFIVARVQEFWLTRVRLPSG